MRRAPSLDFPADFLEMLGFHEQIIAVVRLLASARKQMLQ